MVKISASGFAKYVSRQRSQWPVQYIEDCANEVLEVLSGKYDSISPAAGSDVFYVRKNGNAVIASTRPKGHKRLKTFQLIGEAAL